MQQMTDDMQAYMKIAEAAQHWEISVRRVQVLCAGGKIAGAMRVGRDWLLPRNALRPVDGRTKEGRAGQIEAMRRAEAHRKYNKKNGRNFPSVFRLSFFVIFNKLGTPLSGVIFKQR